MTVEVFAGLLVHVDVFCGNVLLGHSDPLPFLVLVFAGYTDITVVRAFDTTYLLLKNVRLSYHTPTKMPSRTWEGIIVLL